MSFLVLQSLLEADPSSTCTWRAGISQRFTKRFAIIPLPAERRAPQLSGTDLLGSRHGLYLVLERGAVPAAFRGHGMSPERIWQSPLRLIIGAQQMPFKAHAWVEVDGRVVNDKPYTSEIYAVLDRC